MRLKDDLIGKTIECGEEWYGGIVFYRDIYKKDNIFYAKHKIYYNEYSKRVEDCFLDKEVFAPFGFKVVNSTPIDSFDV